MFKKIACYFGRHAVPDNIAFHEMGAICSGGICPYCGNLVQRKLIQNAWTGEVDHGNYVELRGFDVSYAKRLGY